MVLPPSPMHFTSLCGYIKRVYISMSDWRGSWNAGRIPFAALAVKMWLPAVAMGGTGIRNVLGHHSIHQRIFDRSLKRQSFKKMFCWCLGFIGLDEMFVFYILFLHSYKIVMMQSGACLAHLVSFLLPLFWQFFFLRPLYSWWIKQYPI